MAGSFLDALGSTLSSMSSRLKTEANEKAQNIYRNGGNCYGCKYRNANGFCNNSRSVAYDNQSVNICNSRFGVPVCQHYERM